MVDESKPHDEETHDEKVEKSLWRIENLLKALLDELRRK